MFSFKCTRSLVRKLGYPVTNVPPATTTRLGDWYGNVFFVRHQRFIMFVSERSLLPIIMPLRERSQLLPNFRSRLAELLLHLGVTEHDLTAELAEMAEAAVATTASRSVLGSMNDFRWNAKVYLQNRPDFNLLELEAWLAKIPCGPLAFRSPEQVAPELLATAGCTADRR